MPSARVVEDDAAGRRFDHVRVRAVVRQPLRGAMAGLGVRSGRAPLLRRPLVTAVRTQLEGRGAALLGELRDADVALQAEDQFAFTGLPTDLFWHLAGDADAPVVRIVRVPALHVALAVVLAQDDQGRRVREVDVLRVQVLANHPQRHRLRRGPSQRRALAELRRGAIRFEVSVAIRGGNALQVVHHIRRQDARHADPAVGSQLAQVFRRPPFRTMRRREGLAGEHHATVGGLDHGSADDVPIAAGTFVPNDAVVGNGGRRERIAVDAGHAAVVAHEQHMPTRRRFDLHRPFGEQFLVLHAALPIPTESLAVPRVVCRRCLVQ